MSHDIYDLISISLLPLWLSFGIYGIIHSKLIVVYICIAAFFVDVSTQVIKTSLSPFIKHPLFHRPDRNAKCSMFNSNNVKLVGSLAFPSGHMTSAALFSSCIILYYKLHGINAYLLMCYVLAMGVARYKKRCHNIFQISAGILYGILWACIIVNTIAK